MGLSLKKNFGFALVGNLGYAVSQYFILLVFIKLFPIEDVGQFVFAGAFTTPLMMALEMQLRNFYITDQENKLKFSDYSGFRVITTSVGVICMILTAYFVRPEYFYVILIVALIKSFESQLDLLYGVYQKNHHLDYVAYSRIVRGIVAIIVVTSLSLIFEDIVIALLGYLLSWFILYYFYERKQIVLRGFIKKEELAVAFPNWSKTKYLLTICVPMFIAIFVDKYYLNYPRLSVEKYFGLEALAIFGSLLYFKSLGGQLISSLAQAAMPKMANYVKMKEFSSLNKLLYKMILLGTAIGGGLTILSFFFGQPILKILYTEEYSIYNDVLIVILLGTTVTFSYIFISSALTCIRKQWVKLPVSIMSFIILYIWTTIYPLGGIIDVAKIVLYVEIFSFMVYFIIYFIFIHGMKIQEDVK